MLTDEDITKLMGVLATRAEVAEVHADTKALREQVGYVITGIDGIAKSIDDLKMEYVAIKIQLDRHDKWIHALAQKVDLKLVD